MKQEGGIPIESTQLAGLDSAEWIEQYHTENQQKTNDGTTVDNEGEYLNKVEEELGAAGTWVNEFVKENPSAGITNFLEISSDV